MGVHSKALLIATELGDRDLDARCAAFLGDTMRRRGAWLLANARGGGGGGSAGGVLVAPTGEAPSGLDADSAGEGAWAASSISGVC